MGSKINVQGHVRSKLPHNIHCPILPNTLAEKSLLSPNGNTCINSMKCKVFVWKTHMCIQ